MAGADLAIILRAQDNASAALKSVNASLRGLSGAITAPSRAISGLVTGLGRIGLASMGVQAVAQSARGLGDALGVGLKNQMEQVTASFMAFTKSEEETAKILAMVREEADKTPFTFQEMATAAAGLQPAVRASGQSLEELLKTAEILAASNPFQGLEGASFSLREAMTGDFTSIIERFNLSRVTINKLKAEGKSSFEIISGAMREMGFDADLVANKALTLEGRWSTFTDTLDGLRMIVAKPIFDALKVGLIDLQQLFEDNAAALKGFAESIATGFDAAITSVKAVFKAITSDAGALGIVGDQIERVFGKEAADKVRPMLQWLMDNLPNIKTKLGEVADAAGRAGAWLLHQLGAAAEWLQTNVLPKLLEIGGKVKDFLGGPFLDAVKKAADWLLHQLGAAAEWLQTTAFPALQKKAEELAQALSPTLRQAAEEAKKALDDLPEKKTGIQKFFDELEGVGVTLRRAWDNLVATAGFLGEAIQAIIRIMSPLPDDMKKTEGAGLKLKDVLAPLAAIVESVTVALRNFAGALAWFLQRAADIDAAFRQIGRAIGRGLRGGIEEETPRVGEAAGRMAEEAAGMATDALDARSPSRVFWRLGRDIVAGLKRGIEDNASEAVRAARDFLGQVTAQIERQAGVVGRLQKALDIRRLFQRPEELAFERRRLELDKERLDLEERMAPLLKQRQLAEQRMADARKAAEAAKATRTQRDDQAAQRAIEQAEAEIDAAEDALRPYQDLEQAIRDREDALRREEAQWRINTRLQEIGLEEALEFEKRLKEVFESQQEAAQESVRQVEELNQTIQRLPDQKTIRINIETVGEIPSFQRGGVMPWTGPAWLHAGERVLPAGRSSAGGGGQQIVVNVAGSVISEHDLIETIARGLVQRGRRNVSALGGLA